MKNNTKKISNINSNKNNYKHLLNNNSNKRNNKLEKNILTETKKDIKSSINNSVKPLN